MENELRPDFAKGGGVVPVITQDAANGMVLMLAYMNEEAYIGNYCGTLGGLHALWRCGIGEQSRTIGKRNYSL